MVRYYLMIAKPGEEAALRSALEALAAAVRTLEGNVSVELLVDLKDPTRFTFLERWASVEAYDAGSKALPKDTVAPVMAALAEPPQAARLASLLTV